MKKLMLLKFKHLLLVSIFIWLVIFTFEFNSLYKHTANIINRSLLSRAKEFEIENERFSDLLQYANAFFVSDTIIQNENYSSNYFKTHFKYNSNEKVFELASPILNPIGSLTYTGKIPVESKIQEIKRSLALGPIFKKALELFPKSPWVYYTSSDFIYIYPAVNPHEFKFSNETIASEFYQKNLPTVNTTRETIWTNPYYDLAGKGMMITTSMPVYIKNKFQGTLSIDVVLSEINKKINMSSFTDGKLFIINNEGNLITSNNDLLNMSNKVQHLFSSQQLRELNNDDDHIINRFNSIVFFTSVPSFNFYILYEFKLLPFVAGIILKQIFSLIFIITIIFFFTYWWITKKLQTQTEADNIYKNKLISMAELSGGIAHEINNPLTVILGRTRQLKRKNDKNELSPTDLNENLNLIINSSERISKIITTLKNFSRNDNTDLKERFLLEEIIHDTLLLCEHRIKNNDAKLTIDKIPQIKINCHPHQIVQVVINLINNSFDAIVNLEERWVNISFQVENKKIKIFVNDSGRGVKKDIQDKIFEPFYSTKPHGQGSGIGLSISKRIAQYHNGDLILIKNVNNTSFCLILPID
ncbi:MAG: GHKL domain-containing protein [Bacteriovorax sp.]|nr:GHKL domain-containing protein [Bacteriovorax sp.]